MRTSNLKNQQLNHDTYLIVVIIMIWSHFKDIAWMNKATITISFKYKTLSRHAGKAGCQSHKRVIRWWTQICIMVHTLPVALQVRYVCTETADSRYESFPVLNEKESKCRQEKCLCVFLHNVNALCGTYTHFRCFEKMHYQWNVNYGSKKNWGSHSSKNLHHGLLGYDSIRLCRLLQIFQGNLLAPSSGYRANFSETLVNTETIRCHNPENYNQKKDSKSQSKWVGKCFLVFCSSYHKKKNINLCLCSNILIWHL